MSTAILDPYQQLPALIARFQAERPNARVKQALLLVEQIAAKHGGITYQCAMSLLKELALSSRQPQLAAAYLA